jgi:uncharacterized glyoxalase superfamily protein PhnB
MGVKKIPDGYRTITPQLAIDGAGKAIDFYKKAFAAEEVMRAPDPSGQKVWHAVLKIGDSLIFVNDVFPGMGDPRPHHSSFWLYVENCDAWFSRAVEAGCKAASPPADMFWGDRMAHVVDPFGQAWTLATHVKDMTPEELKKAEQAFVAQMAKEGGKH